MGQSALSLLQGTVSLLILRALQKGPAHGYSITRWIHGRTDGSFVIEDAALYQALHRLEAKGFIEAEWGASENNRRARFYALTPGRPAPAPRRSVGVAPLRGSDVESDRRTRLRRRTG